MKAVYFFLFCSLYIYQTAYALDELALSTDQKQMLGIVTAPLQHKQQGELSGMPAQVVIPSNQLLTISTPLAAMVDQTLVGVGDVVTKGQVIATLQSPALAEAQRGFIQAATQEQLAQDNLARDEKLWQDGIISESRYRTTQSQFRESSASLSERKQMLKLSGMTDSSIASLALGNNLNSLLSILSPISGVILEKNASSGQRLDAAVPIFKVAKLDPMGLEIQASLANTQGLKIGASVNIPEYGATGKLTAIGRSLSSGNQTILLRAIIHKGAENLRPGQFVEVNIDTNSDNNNQWNVPNGAVARINGQAYIFVESAKGFSNVTVQVLHEGAQNSLVAAKLKGNERIAVQGVSALKAKMMNIGEGQ